MLRPGCRDDHQVDVRVGDQVVVIPKHVRDVQLCRELVGGLLPTARDRDNPELLERAEGGNVAILRPAAGSDDADSNGVLGHAFSSIHSSPAAITPAAHTKVVTTPI